MTDDHSSAPRTSRRRTLVALGVAGALGAGVAAFSLIGNDGNAANELPCRDRIILIDPSSSMSTDTWNAAQRTVVEAAVSAAVCRTHLTAASAVPGHTVTIVSDDDLVDVRPIGPNLRSRRQRFTAGDRSRLAALVASGMSDVATALPSDRSDIDALLQVAGDRAGASTDVIAITDGVHRDDRVDLDQPLGAGDGAQLAAELPPVHVPAARLRFVGVAEVDADTPPPSDVWAAEVRSFVAAVCGRTGAGSCVVMGAASPTEALR